MTLPDPLLIAIPAALLIAVLLALWLGARSSHAATRQRLAAEEVRAARLPGLEQELDQTRSRLESSRHDHAAAQAIISARNADLAGMEVAVTDLRTRLAATDATLATAQAHATSLQAANATLQEARDQERRAADEKLAMLRAARTDMSNEFKTLAEEVMTRHGASFTKLNHDQMDTILKPLKEKLGEFQQKVHDTHLDTVREQARLGEQIKAITETGAVMTRETKDLADALRGRSQVQGAWGEMVLATVLEQSGLRPGAEYAVQQSFTNDANRHLRPDVIVNLPGGQRMVVDAKVSLTAYESLARAATDDARTALLGDHAASLRTHIATLGSKDYQRAAGSALDYVIMFVPIEGALAAALRHDDRLIGFAIERNVMITTPTTLMLALRTVANIWTTERRNQNAEDIASRAGRIYDKFVGVIADLRAVGDAMTRTRTAYDTAMGKLSDGQGNVVRQLEQLKSMGARTAKSLPPDIVDRADASLSLHATTIETEVSTRTTTHHLVADLNIEPPAPVLTP